MVAWQPVQLKDPVSRQDRVKSQDSCTMNWRPRPSLCFHLCSRVRQWRVAVATNSNDPRSLAAGLPPGLWHYWEVEELLRQRTEWAGVGSLEFALERAWLLLTLSLCFPASVRWAASSPQMPLPWCPTPLESNGKQPTDYSLKYLKPRAWIGIFPPLLRLIKYNFCPSDTRLTKTHTVTVVCNGKSILVPWQIAETLVVCTAGESAVKRTAVRDACAWLSPF